MLVTVQIVMPQSSTYSNVVDTKAPIFYLTGRSVIHHEKDKPYSDGGANVTDF